MKNIHVLPKEEPKQDYSGVHLRHCYQGEYKNGCKYGEDDCPAKPLEEPKQESLEEAAERLQKHKYGVFISKDADVKGQLVIDTAKAAFATGFVEGAKWQAERMYSEEELKHAFFSGCQSERQIKPRIECWEQWFEQLKKK